MQFNTSQEPGASALVHAFKKRPKVDPRALAEQQRAEVAAAMAAQIAALQREQFLLAQRMAAEASGQGTVVTKVSGSDQQTNQQTNQSINQSIDQSITRLGGLIMSLRPWSSHQHTFREGLIYESMDE